MSYRRSLTTRARLLAQQRLIAPSFSYAHHEDDRKNPHAYEKVNYSLQNRSYSCLRNNTNSSLGFGGGNGGVSFRDPRWSQFLHAPLTTSGFLFARNISTTIGDGKVKTEHMTDTIDAVVDKTMEVVSNEAAAVSEVAVAAADCWPPVQALQYGIEWIHMSTGLDWWACIVIATLCMRALLVPITINQLKCTSKLPILRAELEKIMKKMQDKSMSPEAVAEVKSQKKRVQTEYAGAIYTQLGRLFIQPPVYVCFFLAIRNMVENVPSFQTGGLSWFLDLTTTDSLYILPFLIAFSSWMNFEFNIQDGTMKIFGRVCSALSLPLTACFPTALNCYWITFNCFTFVDGMIMKMPSVKKFFNIPIIVPPPPSSPASQSEPLIRNQSVTLSSLPMIQKPTTEELKSTTKKVSSSSILNHRIKNLEKQVKGRKQNKRKKR